jgi:hypothetical protein
MNSSNEKDASGSVIPEASFFKGGMMEDFRKICIKTR